MFDLSSSKLLVLAIVALLVVGPKDLPALLRTIGRYLGMLQRQAAEFRAQFEEAMRETELADLKKDIEKIGSEAQDTLRDAGRSLESELGDVRSEVEKLNTATEGALQDAGHQVNDEFAASRSESGEAGPHPEPAAGSAAATAEGAATRRTDLQTADPGAIEPPQPPVPAKPVLKVRETADAPDATLASPTAGA